MDHTNYKAFLKNRTGNQSIDAFLDRFEKVNGDYYTGDLDLKLVLGFPDPVNGLKIDELGLWTMINGKEAIKTAAKRALMLQYKDTRIRAGSESQQHFKRRMTCIEQHLFDDARVKGAQIGVHTFVNGKKIGYEISWENPIHSQRAIFDLFVPFDECNMPGDGHWHTEHRLDGQFSMNKFHQTIIKKLSEVSQLLAN